MRAFFWGAVVAALVLASVACGSDDASGGATGPAGPDGGSSIGPGGSTGTVPLTTHPRLLVRESDLERLRGWATPANPIFAGGLEVAARKCARLMDEGKVDADQGSATGYSETPTEGFAEIFAFLSLVSPDPAAREDYAKRARTLLMRAINEAAKGVADGQKFRNHNFATSDRSRWHGEGFALTVDWIYGSLTAEDKATIRTVFLRWADEITRADTTNHNHPEPIGVVNDPRLIADKNNVRWAANNYYAAHIRNLGLMALAMDPADDPEEKLGGYLKSVTGAWLYVSDALMRGDMAGGLGAEGGEYAPQSIGYVAQLLAALFSSGRGDPAVHGPQATFDSPFWDAFLPAYVHSLSPDAKPPADATFAYLGPLHAIAWYGDGDRNWSTDPIAMFGALGLRDQLANNTKRLAQTRWVATNAPAGGAPRLTERAADANFTIDPILHFLLWDPAGAPAEDPRPSLPLTHFAPGLGRILARSSWNDDASWFTYKLSWSTIDHQHSDGNLFELYRKGEWLTKERTGYGVEIGCSDYKNALALENDVPEHNEGYRATLYQRGSQWIHASDNEPKLLTSVNDTFSYAFGDATSLYNSSRENSTDITHASRSIVWLPPDRVVTYDRAASKKPNRFKRFWLNLPNGGTVNGKLVTMTTPKGQKLFVRSLLPADGAVTVEAVEGLDSQPATLDRVSHRMRVEVASKPQSLRFLHVLQGADAAGTADPSTLIASTAGTAYQGVAVNGVVVMFPVDVGAGSGTSYPSPGGIRAHLITGLTPGAKYSFTESGGNVTIAAGGNEAADAGGVLLHGSL